MELIDLQLPRRGPIGREFNPNESKSNDVRDNFWTLLNKLKKRKDNHQAPDGADEPFIVQKDEKMLP